MSDTVPFTQEMPGRIPGASQIITATILSVLSTASVLLATATVAAAANERAEGGPSKMVTARKAFDLHTHGSAVAAGWSRDGSALAAASNFGSQLTVWRSDGTLIRTISRQGDGPVLGGSVAFGTSDTQLLFAPPAASPNDVAAAVWSLTTGTVEALIVGPQPGDDYPLNRLQHFEFTPDHSLLVGATIGQDAFKSFKKNIVTYEPRTWGIKRLFSIPEGAASLCVFGQGHYVGIGTIRSGRLYILDLTTGRDATTLDTFGASPFGTYSIGAVAGSPMGDMVLVGLGSVATTSRSPESIAWEKDLSTTGAARVYRATDGKMLMAIQNAKAPIRRAEWDPKGRFVAFVDDNSTLFLAPAPRGGSPVRIELPTPALAMAISPSGDHIAVTTDFGIRIFTVSD